MRRRSPTMRDLVDEAKKRAVLLLVLVIGLSYLMSLTSSSVWVNLPAAASLIIFCRYISLDFVVRRKSSWAEKPLSLDISSQKNPVELLKFPLEKPSWREKVDSHLVEEAIDHFTGHLVSEWVTDLWYSRITPDKDAPEELTQILNGVFGEISRRAKDVNLINLLTRDIIHLICNHLELYFSRLSKVGLQELEKLSPDARDMRLRQSLAADNKLHPALFSLEAEHKVLQQYMDAIISLTFKPEDLQCSFFRYLARELLACAVFRPVLNMANPRFINEKIETLVHSLANKAKAAKITEGAPMVRPSGILRTSAAQLSGLQDHSAIGVELVQLKHDNAKGLSDESMLKPSSGVLPRNYTEESLSGNRCVNQASKGIHHASEIVSNGAHLHNDRSIEQHTLGSEWSQMLDVVSRRKSQALAPEHFENVWTKGRNYSKKNGENHVAEPAPNNVCRGTSSGTSQVVPFNDVMYTGRLPKSERSTTDLEDQYKAGKKYFLADNNGGNNHMIISYRGKEDYSNDEVEPGSDSSYQTDDDESSTVTGLDSPGTRIWDSKSKKSASDSRIRHPLETFKFHGGKKHDRSHICHPRVSRTSSARKRYRTRNHKIPLWQEVERTSFLSGDGRDILNALKDDTEKEEPSDDHDVEFWGSIRSGTTATYSAPSISASESLGSSTKINEYHVLADSFLKLRCEVLGANVVKSGSGTFAVYSIGVVDANNNRWSIKRRFRHFEELHRRLKEFPEYNLCLPPKHFLSSGLDVAVIKERCKLLDKYLKKLLQLPAVSGSIEVWDFLSVDSQTYMFSDSLSIIETLSVKLDDKPYEKGANDHASIRNGKRELNSNIESWNSLNKESSLMDKNSVSVSLGFKARNAEQCSGMNHSYLGRTKHHDDTKRDSDYKFQKDVPPVSMPNKPGRETNVTSDDPSQVFDADDDLNLPSEWVSPSPSVPLFDLVDVIFQLQDGGWIRRQAFWIAKQILQLGMGDAFDDWLIEKIQLLGKGPVIASAISRVEQILWPDGIFLTKHPNRKPRTPIASPREGMNLVDNAQQQEAERRAKFVYQLIVEKAPLALVSLVGRKEYERCSQDIYFFIQSHVCLRQLAFELLELLLLALFPELDDLVRQCHENKGQFGSLEDTIKI